MQITITLTDTTIRTDTNWEKSEENLSEYEKLSLLTEALAVGIREIAKLYLPDVKRVNYIRAFTKILNKL